jgi:hypothetical protein
VALDLAFYRLVYLRDAWTAVLARMRALLKKGIRSPGSEFSSDLAKVRDSAQPHLAVLAAIAAVVSDQAPLSSLEVFPEWKQVAAA